MPSSIKQFSFAYMLAVIVIIIEVIGAQILIQVALKQEVDHRAAATILGRQQGRTLKLFLNIEKIVQQPGTRQDDIARIKNIVGLWHEVEGSVYAGDPTIGVPGNLDDTIINYAKSAKGDYEALKNAVDAVIVSKPTDDLTPQVQVFLTHEQNYIDQWAAIFNLLTAQADQLVINVQAIELGLFALTIATILFEVFFAFRPALRQLKNIMQEKEKLVDVYSKRKNLS